jgi:hypothetical protein
MEAGERRLVAAKREMGLIAGRQAAPNFLSSHCSRRCRGGEALKRALVIELDEDPAVRRRTAVAHHNMFNFGRMQEVWRER